MRTFLFLHGWGGSVSSFKGVARWLGIVGYYAVLVDFAGFGKTKEPREPFCVDDYAQDVERFLKEHKITKASIVAHSFGGRVAIKLAAKNSGLVDKLVLVDSAGIKPRRGIIYKYKVYKYKLYGSGQIVADYAKGYKSFKHIPI